MRIAVSGINANDNPGPGIGVARSIKEMDPNIQIVGFSYDGNDSGHFLKEYFQETYLMPYPNKGWGDLRKKLEVINQNKKLDLIIPCLDAELPLYIRYQKEIESLFGIRLFLPSKKQYEDRDKNQLAHLASSIGASYPKTTAVNSVNQMLKVIDDSFAFPFFIKGNYYKAYRVNTYYEAMARFEEIANEWGYPILLQKIVTGTELNLVGFGDGRGNLLGAVAIKKLSTTYLGKIWTAITIRNEELSTIAARFVKTTHWKGPFELECISSPQGMNIIEINPRFPAWTYFATACGINLPAKLIQTINAPRLSSLNTTEKMPDYGAGKLLIRYCEEIVTDVTSMFNDQPAKGEGINEEPKLPKKKTA